MEKWVLHMVYAQLEEYFEETGRMQVEIQII